MKSNLSPLLHGERVYLHRPTMDDLNVVFRWECDEEVWRYDPYRPYARTMTDFQPVFKRNYVRGAGHQCWFIIEDEHHVPIGTITYFNLDARGTEAEIGLGLGEKSRWGQGYGPDAIQTLAQYLFTFPNIVRVYAKTAVANHPARRAFAKAGFTEVGPVYDPRSRGQAWLMLEKLRSTPHEDIH